jgi:hypothetical protein
MSCILGRGVDFYWQIKKNVRGYVHGLFKVAIEHLARETEKKHEHLRQEQQEVRPILEIRTI